MKWSERPMDEVNQAAFVDAVGTYVRECDIYGGAFPATKNRLGDMGIAANHAITAGVRLINAVDAALEACDPGAEKRSALEAARNELATAIGREPRDFAAERLSGMRGRKQ